jgi:hypothetical protein
VPELVTKADPCRCLIADRAYDARSDKPHKGSHV